nr:ATP-binding protein [Maliibacterium massiliense]
MLTVLLAFFNIAITSMMERVLVEERVNEQRVLADSMAIDVAPLFASNDAEGMFAFATQAGEENGGRMLIADANAVVQTDPFSQNNGKVLTHREVQDVLTGGKDFSYGFHREVKEIPNPTSALNTEKSSNWLMYSVSPIVRDGACVGVVLFSASVQDIVDTVGVMRQQMQVNALGITMLIMIISYFMSIMIVNPIEELTRAIETMSREKFNRHIEVQSSGHSELSRLATSFNAMSAKLESLEKARNEFVSNASHELKTPLSSMKILTESLIHLDSFDPELTREFLGDINHEIDRLNTLISDLLLLARMDKQGSAFAFVPVQLDDLVVRTVKNLVPLARSKRITILVDIARPVCVRGEETRLQQMLTNLVDNAIKYTPEEGKVTVSLDEQGARALLAVRDTGMGIPQDALPHLFERFYRVDRARTRDTGGTGLGLAIVQQIVEMHQGSINVQSHEGEGSAFMVSLPAYHRKDKKELPPPEADAHDLQA